jgi:hypothetical protein
MPRRCPPPALALLALFALGCGDDEPSGTGGNGAGGAGTGTGGEAATTATTASSSAAASGAGGAGGEPVTPILETISVSDQSEHEREPQIVVTETGRVVVSWMDANPDPDDYFHVAYRISDDRGETWGPVTSIPLPEDNNVGANATLAVAPDGAVWLSWASQHRTQTTRSNQRVFVARLGADEEAFGDPILVTDPEVEVGVYDQPAITVSDAGHLVVSVGQANPALTAVWASLHRSEDGGASWERSIPSQEEAPSTYQNLIHPCRAEGTDRIYLYYVDAQIGLSLWRSEDGGRTWPTDQRVRVQAEDELFTISTGLESNCVARGDEVWAVYGLSDDDAGSGDRLPTLYSIRLAHSSDGGASFDSWTTIEDPSVGPKYMLPRLALEDDGALDVMYVAGTGDDDPAASYRRARSTDGGLTFGPSVPVLEPVTYESTRSSAATFGDYTGIVAHDGALYGAITDNATGEGHIVFFRTAP